MGIFFKQMSESQIKNSRQGIYQGFYVYMMLLLVNVIGDYFFEGPLFSSAFVFWAGIIASSGWAFILDLKDKRRQKKAP
ncbi:hypothetical protein CEH05_08495 [Halobacillus halophilus]|uniref:Uncharacterized protein n=2 Tax=Halobacillus halophilus TaxID=1570 RepID=I0JLM7_HALH3|nr:hypothetical protein CEH05_08495 [Halobacillus halophilus]CCG45047.1 hypothetical protein HBHAL_2697 [Halobacillus halophilus DSM 2266]